MATSAIRLSGGFQKTNPRAEQMSAQLIRQGNQTQLVITEEFTIYQAQTIRDAMVAALASDTAVTIDLEAVTEIDCSGVQLLDAWRTEAARTGRTVRCVNPSPAVTSALEILRVTDLIVTDHGSPSTAPTSTTAKNRKRKAARAAR